MMHDLQLLPHSPLGRAISLQLIRRNQQCNVSEAMAPVDINLQYDFDFQQFTFLPNEVRVLPVSNHIKLHVVRSMSLQGTPNTDTHSVQAAAIQQQ